MSAILASRPELIPQLAKYNGPLSRSFASQIDDRDNGQDPIILFTYREPVDAWVNGIQNRVNEGGYVVSPEIFVSTHVES